MRTNPPPKKWKPKTIPVDLVVGGDVVESFAINTDDERAAMDHVAKHARAFIAHGMWDDLSVVVLARESGAKDRIR